MNAKKLLEELTVFINSDTVHMYIIERKIKENSKAKDRASEKFEYSPLQVNVSNDLMPVLTGMLKRAIEKKVKEDVSIKTYEVIDDTIDKIYYYNDLGKIAGFNDFLTNKLNKEISALKSFKELEEFEKAWALCYGFYDSKSKRWLYCIKKLSPRRLAIESDLSTGIAEAIKHGVTSLFDLETKTLKPLNGFALNIEPSIDMIYLEEVIYIFQKKAFEDITSLTEEFESVAHDLVAEIDELEFVDGLEHLSGVISNKPAFRNKLIKAKSIGNLDFLKNCKDIKKEFQRAGKKLEIKFKFDKEGKIIATNDAEAEDIIKVLSEYYKEGIFGGKIFESPAGRLKTNG